MKLITLAELVMYDRISGAVMNEYGLSEYKSKYGNCLLQVFTGLICIKCFYEMFCRKLE